MKAGQPDAAKTPLASASSDTIQVITEALRGLQFGTVKLVVQDGVLIRVERTENRQVCRSPRPRIN